MDTDAKGQLGGIECSNDARARMAKDSGAWTCAGCGKSNANIMREREELVAATGEGDQGSKEDEVPEELRLAYRDELANEQKDGAPKVDKGKGKAVVTSSQAASSSTPSLATTASGSSSSTGPAASSGPPPRLVSTTQPPRPIRPNVQRGPERPLAWIDTCIYGIVAALLFMLIRKLG